MALTPSRAMKAYGITRYLPIDAPGSIVAFETQVPEPGPTEILVRVEAISVIPIDTKIRRSKSPEVVEDPPRILGWDAAGVVLGKGDRVTMFSKGDEVYCMADFTKHAESLTEAHRRLEASVPIWKFILSG